MEVKGEILISIRLFVRKKFGQNSLDNWQKVLSPETRKIFNSPIKINEWYPMETVIEATSAICDMFYHESLQGAWESGEFSAEYGLKGLRIILSKLLTPQILITKSSVLLQNYYRPSRLEIVDSSRNMAVIRITEFADIHKVIEYRIAGWIHRSGKISGARDIDVAISSALTRGDPYTEYYVQWQ